MLLDIPTVNQTQVAIEGREEVTIEEIKVNVVVTNERVMELLHLLKMAEGKGLARDVGPVLGILGAKTIEDLAEIKVEGNR